LKTEMI